MRDSMKTSLYSMQILFATFSISSGVLILVYTGTASRNDKYYYESIENSLLNLESLI